MQRLDNLDDARFQAQREAYASDLTSAEQEEDERDRRDRDVVAFYENAQGDWVESPLRRDDDVLCEDVVYRVVGPARGRSRFYGYRIHERYGEMVVPVDLSSVVDRVPADEDEDPMPVMAGVDTDLAPLRQAAFAKVDARSQELIAAGFTYKDIVFSASLEAQARYNGMMAFLDVLEFPLGINSLDDTTNLPLESAQDARAFCLSALGHIKAVVDSGSAQKQAIRDMTEPAQLREYQDAR